MKAVLISIQPKWCELIANGKKTIEVRKTMPKIQTPFKCYIYCTKAKSHYAGGHIGLSDDELYKLPDGQIKYGSSIELMLHDNYTVDNFLNGKVIGEFICDRILTVDCDSVAPFDPETHEYIGKECCFDRDTLWEYTNGYCCYGWHISEIVIYDEPKELLNFYKADFEEIYSQWEDLHNIGVKGIECVSYPSEPKEEDYKLKRAPQSWCYVEEVA